MSKIYMQKGEEVMDKEKTMIEKNCIYCGVKFEAPLTVHDKPQMDGEYWGICDHCVPSSYLQINSITLYCPDCGRKLPEEPKICPACHYGDIKQSVDLEIKHFKKIEKGDWLIVHLPKDCRGQERKGIAFNIQYIVEQTGAQAIILPQGVILKLWKNWWKGIKRRILT